MKISTLISFLLLLLTVASCGGGKSKMKLEVSRSFATGVNPFKGGLFIHGSKQGSTEEFSLALESGNSQSVELDFGIWNIRVIAWDPITAPIVTNEQSMSEIPYCDYQEVNFNTDGQSANFQVTNAKCNNTVFADNISSTASVSFSQIRFMFCGALYNPANPTELLNLSTLTTASEFCQYPGTPRVNAKGMIITLTTKLPGQSEVPGISTECLSTDSALPEFTSFLKSTKTIPSKIPLKISLYENDECTATKKMGEFNFPKGISIGSSDFDFAYGQISGEVIKSLALPDPFSKRGRTIFANQNPLFRCGNTKPGTPCIALPNKVNVAGTTYDYVLNQGRNRIRLPEYVSCEAIDDGTYTVTTTSPGGLVEYEECEERDNQTFFTLNVIGGTSKGTTGTLIIDKPTVDDTYTLIVEEHKNTLEQIIPYIEVARSSNDISSSLYNHGKESSNFSGIFRDVNEILSPGILGGLFWTSNLCEIATTPIIKTVSHKEDGELKDYIVSMKSISLPSQIVSGLNFNRRLVIAENKVPLSPKTQMVLDLVCDGSGTQVGRLEEHFEEIKASEDEKIIEKTILYWDTTNILSQRFEEYRTETRKNLTDDSIEKIYNSFVQGRVQSITGSQKFRLSKLHYDFSPTHGEHTEHTQIDLDNTNGLITSSVLGGIHNQSTTPKIFVNDLYQNERSRIRYGITDPTSSVKQANGKFIRAYFIDSSNPLHIEVFDGTEFYHTEDNIPTNGSSIASDISDDGAKAVVVTNFNNSLRVRVIDMANGSFISETNVDLIDTDNDPEPDASKAEVAIFNDGTVFLAARNNSNRFFKNRWIPTDGTPVTLTNTTAFNASAVSDIIKNFAIAKQGDISWLAINRQSGPITITVCAYSPSTSDCKNFEDENAIPIHDVSSYVKDGRFQVSYRFYDSPSSTSMNRLISAEFDGTSIITPSYAPFTYALNIFQDIIKSNLDLSTFYGADGTGTVQEIPYSRPIANNGSQNFEMNFESLNPVIIDTYFTSGFESIAP